MSLNSDNKIEYLLDYNIIFRNLTFYWNFGMTKSALHILYGFDVGSIYIENLFIEECFNIESPLIEIVY